MKFNKQNLLMDEILVGNIIHLSENKCVRNFLILFSALGLLILLKKSGFQSSSITLFISCLFDFHLIFQQY